MAEPVCVAPAGDRTGEGAVGNVTTCTLGGPDLKTLYITTAERLAGSLFTLAVDVPGLPENKFHLGHGKAD